MIDRESPSAESVQLAIVGAGPAGLAAAAEAVAQGLAVTVVDASPLPGGQYYKQTPPALGTTETRDRYAERLLEAARESAVRLIADTTVWGLFPADRVTAIDMRQAPPARAVGDAAFAHGAPQSPPGETSGRGYLLCLYGPPGTPRRLHAQTLILAPGAYDRPVPFPGWTLPGVMTAGAALTLVKHQHVVPGRRILLSGTGPLLLVLVRHILAAGAKVEAVLDANPFPARGWRHAAAVWGQWERLREGWDALRAVQRSGTPIHWGHCVWRAEGQNGVQRAVIGPVVGPRGGAPRETVEVDTICLAHGFTPAVQLSRLAGCEHYYHPVQRAYVPVRDDWQETTRPGLFVAGDGAGVAGKDVARLEGRLAALGATRVLAHMAPTLSRRASAPEQVSALRRALRRHRRFAAVLEGLFPPSPDLIDLLEDDTVLCRCEEITVRQVRQAIADGATSVSAVRMLTRAGMGRCQGRMCSMPVAELVAWETGHPVATVGQAAPRPPVVPIPLEGLLEAEP